MTNEDFSPSTDMDLDATTHRPLVSRDIPPPTQFPRGFSSRTSVEYTTIPIGAYLHLQTYDRPYKSAMEVPKGLPAVNLNKIQTIEDLNYIPKNRNLAIKQTLANYYSTHLPEKLAHGFSRLVGDPGRRTLQAGRHLLGRSHSQRSSKATIQCSTSSLDSLDTSSSSSSSTSSLRPRSEAFSEPITLNGESTAPFDPSCATPALTPPLASTSGFDLLTGNVVILGGFRGSVLESMPQEGPRPRPPKVLWPNLHEALVKDSDPDLAMLLSADSAYSSAAEGEVRSKDLSNNARAKKMLDRVSLGPLLPPVLDLGYSLRKKLERIDRRRVALAKRAGLPPPVRLRVEDWGYDFRADLDESSDKLIEHLTRLKEQSLQLGERAGATVLAHSMGGLVVLNALAKAPDVSIFKQVVFLGTPFLGCPGIFSPFRYGDGFFRQVNLCNPVTSSSWPSAFHLIPQKPTFITADGKPIDLDLSDPRTWDTYGLSPLAAGVSAQGACESSARQLQQEQIMADLVEPPARAMNESDPMNIVPPHRLSGLPPTASLYSKSAKVVLRDPLHPAAASPEVIRQHFSRCFSRSQAFHQRLSAPFKNQSQMPPLAIIASNKERTVKEILFSSDEPESFLKEGYRQLVYDWGDGVILWESATGIPGPWGSQVKKVVESQFGHMALLSDHGTIETALKALECSRISQRNY